MFDGILQDLFSKLKEPLNDPKKRDYLLKKLNLTLEQITGHDVYEAMVGRWDAQITVLSGKDADGTEFKLYIVPEPEKRPITQPAA